MEGGKFLPKEEGKGGVARLQCNFATGKASPRWRNRMGRGQNLEGGRAFGCTFGPSLSSSSSSFFSYLLSSQRRRLLLLLLLLSPHMDGAEREGNSTKFEGIFSPILGPIEFRSYFCIATEWVIQTLCVYGRRNMTPTYFPRELK